MLTDGGEEQCIVFHSHPQEGYGHTQGSVSRHHQPNTFRRPHDAVVQCEAHPAHSHEPVQTPAGDEAPLSVQSQTLKHEGHAHSCCLAAHQPALQQSEIRKKVESVRGTTGVHVNALPFRQNIN